MQKQEEKKALYALHVLRRDEQHISVLESTDYDKVFEAYKELSEQWGNCVKTQTPFSLSTPVVTTFDPGLIYEITIRPIQSPIVASKYDNPYAKDMMKNGLQNPFGTGPVLDGGYK